MGTLVRVLLGVLGVILFGLLFGLLWGATVTFLEKRNASVLVWLMSIAGSLMLMMLLYYVFVMLGIPLGSA
ncbi:MAG TPA: hypothetical protein VI542_16735 [Candidatus Tectomicrobia bacterium]